jgi:peptidoglycan/LPS O-acetylase OafA/YrhL
MIANTSAKAVSIAAIHSYRPDIDGLRALAVLSVVCFHAWPEALRGGFVGVDVFFVISGYLISRIIIEALECGTFNFAGFYSRRILRIFPSFIVVLVACYAFAWFVLLPDEFELLGKHVAAGAGFISNIVLWSESGYFDVASELKPLLHLWSLGIEEQFYIFWPILLYVAWRLRVDRLYLIAAVLIASFTANVILVRIDPVATFYSPFTRAWELLLGSVLAYATSPRNQ